MDRPRRLDWGAVLQWVLVIVLALVLWPSTLGGRSSLVMVAGGSMEPTYQYGDAVVAWRQPVEIGDIVLYRIPDGSPGEGKTVIHRVVGGDGSGWITQGDHSTEADIWYPSDVDVLGVAQFKVPLGGDVLAVFRSWWFIAAMVGLACGLLLWPDSSNGRRRRGRHRM